MVMVRKDEIEILKNMAIDVGIMSSGIHILVNAVMPLFPPEEFRGKSKAAAFRVVLKQVWRQKDEIMASLPKLEGVIVQIDPIYKKYLKLKTDGNSEHSG